MLVVLFHERNIYFTRTSDNKTKPKTKSSTNKIYFQYLLIRICQTFYNTAGFALDAAAFTLQTKWLLSMYSVCENFRFMQSVRSLCYLVLFTR